MRSNLEHDLCEALDAAGSEYEQAVEAVTMISREIAAGSGREQTFGRLQQIAVATRATETRVARLRNDWSESGQRPGARLQAVLRRQEGILRTLIQSLDQAEQTARAAQGTLLHAFDGAARSQKMHTAYARTIRQAAE